MLEAPEVQAFDMSNVITESDKCSGQYKSSSHFHGKQEIATRYNIPVIWIYGITEHDKGEIDVGGIAKNTIHQEFAKGISIIFFSWRYCSSFENKIWKTQIIVSKRFHVRS